MSKKNQEKTKSTFTKEFLGFRGPYEGPLVNLNSEITTTKLENKYSKDIPVFIDTQGHLYDLYYCPIEQSENSTKFRKGKLPKIEELSIITNEELQTRSERTNLYSQVICKDPKEILPFPDPDDYDTFEQFEEASLKWEEQIEESFGLLQLPELLGGNFYRLKDTTKKFFSDTDGKTETETDLVTENDLITEYDVEIEEDDDENESIPEMKLDEDKPILKMNEEFQIYKMLQNNKNEKIKIPKDEFSVDLKKVLLGSDPWDTSLLPSEPKPNYYKTFGEYERACRRWSQIVVEQLKDMPMHARQLEKQALLKPYKKKIKKTKKKQFNDFVRNYSTWRENIIYNAESQQKHLLNNKAFSITNSYLINPLVKKLIKKENDNNKNKNKYNTMEITPIKKREKNSTEGTWNLLNEETKDQIQSVFAKFSSKISTNEKLYESSQSPLLGRLKPFKVRSNTKSISPKITENLSVFRYERIDVKKEIEQQRYICPNKIEDIKIMFDIPKYDSQKPIPFKNLKTRENYKEYEEKIQFQDFSFRFKKFYSRHNYHRYPPSYNQQIMKKIEKILQKKKINIKKIKQLLMYQQFYDEFKTLFEKKKPMRKYRKTLINSINSNNFHELTTIFEETANQFVHTNLSFYITKIIYSKKATKILQKIIEKKNLKCLYYIVYSLQYFNVIPMSIFPVFEEMKYLIHQIFPEFKFYDELIENLHLYYYLQVILIEYSDGNYRINDDFQNLIKDKLNEISNGLIDLFKKEPEILDKIIFKGIALRSSKVSMYFLFLLIRIFKINSELILPNSNDELAIIDQFELLGLSKFIHSQNAAKVILKLFQKDEFIKNFAKGYSMDFDLLIGQLFAHSSMLEFVDFPNNSVLQGGMMNEINSYLKKEKIFDEYEYEDDNELISNNFKNKGLLTQNNIFRHPPSITILVSNYFNFIYKKLPNNKKLIDLSESIILSEKLYNEIIAKLKKNIKKHSPSLVLIASFLSQMVKCLVKMNLIIGTHQINTKNMNKNKRKDRKEKKENEKLGNFEALQRPQSNEKKVKSEHHNKKDRRKGKGKGKGKGKESEIENKSDKARQNTKSKKKRHRRRMFRSLSLKRGQLQTILNDKSKDNASHLKSFYLNEGIPNKDKGKGNDYIMSKENDSLKVNQIVIKQNKILQILNLINDAPEDAFELKRFLIKILMYLLRVRSIFMEVYQNGLIFENLIKLCTEIRDFKLNKTTWKLFYQLILYHSETIPFLLDNQLLKQFVDLLTISSGIGVINQLYYLNKIFNMPQIEKTKFLGDERYQYKRNYEANPLKSYLKDSRAICSFFESNLHHTKFSRLFKSYIITFAGAPFFNLAQIYYTIMDLKYCSKLKNEFKSSQEYKEALDWFSQNRVISNLTNELKNKKKKRKRQKSLFKF
ncbi:sca1 complex scaffold protein scaa [Anaeramoeba flamelloides]|uniref:Sca1 complex scaffold protein scaa n=1 Tax=Anaeramoeba flamelloides TaxID=1746091 RepID=A0AAV8A7X1_9EUKA|nr:sca1 complex scaffold protein scaa [Anaeramoeba flamelloides]